MNGWANDRQRFYHWFAKKYSEEKEDDKEDQKLLCKSVTDRNLTVNLITIFRLFKSISTNSVFARIIILQSKFFCLVGTERDNFPSTEVKIFQ